MSEVEPTPRAGRLSAAVAAVVLAAAGLAWFVLRDAAPPPAPAADLRETPQPATVQRRPRAAAHAAETPPAQAAETPTDAPSAADEPRKTRALRVVVVAEDGGAPIEGALLRIDDRDMGGRLLRTIRTATGADGVATADVAEYGTPLLVVRKPGRRPVRRDACFDDVEERVALAPGVPVRGRVLFAGARAAAAGAEIRAWNEPTPEEHEKRADVEEIDDALVADAEGRFELAGAELGRTIRVVAAKAGFASVEATRTVTGTGPDLEMVLGEGGVLFGEVRGKDGGPAADVEVFLAKDGETDVQHDSNPWHVLDAFVRTAARTDDDGRYEIRGVPLAADGKAPQAFPAARDAKGHVVRAASATFLHAEERQRRDFRFGGTSLKVRVTGAPATWTGRLLVSGAGREIPRGLSEQATTADFDDLLPGEFKAVLSVEGNLISRAVEVAEGEQADLEIGWPGDRTLEGVVVDVKGAPVPYVLLQFDSWSETRGGVTARAWTSADGSFAFRNLSPDAGTVTSQESDAYARIRASDVRPGGAPLRLLFGRRATVAMRLTRVGPPPVPNVAPIVGVEFAPHQWQGAWITQRDDGTSVASPPFLGAGLLLFVDVEGYAPVVFENQTLAPGATLDLGEVRLDAGLAFDGRLLDADGGPVANAVLVETDAWTLGGFPGADAQGRFHATGLPRCTHHVVVRETETTSAWRIAFDPRAGSGEFTVGKGARVAGCVVDASGAPLAGARVALGAPDQTMGETFFYADSDAEGRFAGRVQPGRYGVVVWDGKRRRAPEPAEIEVPADGDASIELRVR